MGNKVRNPRAHVERVLGIDILRDFQIPRSVIQAELRKLGISEAAILKTVKEARRVTEEMIERSKANFPPSSQKIRKQKKAPHKK